MSPQFKTVKVTHPRVVLFTEELITDEFQPLVNRGEFVFLDSNATAKEGDLVAVESKTYPGYRLTYYIKGVDYFSVGIGVGRSLNKFSTLKA
jgi:hypothetical protein